MGGADLSAAVTGAAKKRKKDVSARQEDSVVAEKKTKRAGEAREVPSAVAAGNGERHSGGDVAKTKTKKSKKGAEAVAELIHDQNQDHSSNNRQAQKRKKEKKGKPVIPVEAQEQANEQNGAGHSKQKSKKIGKKVKAGGDGGALQKNAEQNPPAPAGDVEVQKDDSVLASSQDLAAHWKGIAVAVTGRGKDDPSLQPLKTFKEADLPAALLQSCENFKQPSPIQAHTWPVLLAKRDLIGIAATGSGKTLAYGIPALAHILQLGAPQSRGKPECLVLAPTRELAKQISDVLEAVGDKCGVRTVCVYGGVPKGPQRSALRNATVVVATPGRLQDLLEEGACQLGALRCLVLDEADRMLDLGFEPAIRAIAALTPSERQTVMLSATWPPDVDQLAAEFLRDPIKVTVGSKDLSANHDVRQIVEVVEDRARDARLESLLRQYHGSRKNRVLVFVLYKKEALRVETLLAQRGWSVVAVHGDKGQADRTRAVAAFKDGSVPLLVATDVAARGLDIPHVEYVINYSFPLTAEDYVHRIGRTGRAGCKGVAHTFFTHNDRARAGELVNILREAGQTVPEDLLKFGTTVKKKESKLYGAHFREITSDTPKATKIKFEDSD